MASQTQKSFLEQRNRGMEIFFFSPEKSLLQGGKLFSGHALLIDIAVLTQFLCEAFKRAPEIWPTDSGKQVSFCSDAHGWRSEGLRPREHAALYFVMTSPGGRRCRDTNIQEPLS